MDSFRIFTGSLALLSALLLSVHAGPLNQSPSDVTVQLGASATFECRAAASSDTLFWYVYGARGMEADRKIFYVKDGTATFLEGVDTGKYGNNETFNLVVKTTLKEDALTYGCYSTSADKTEHANLVVIESLTVTTSPQTNLNVGTTVTVTCTLNYGAPTNNTKPLADDQDPQLKMSIDGKVLNAPVYNPSHEQRIAIYNTTITDQDAGKLIVCEMSSAGVRLTANATLGNTARPTDLKLNVTEGPIIKVNRYDVINCSAKGTPPPDVQWVPLGLAPPDSDNSKKGEYGPGWALLSFDHRGSVKWNCTAKPKGYSPAQTNTTGGNPNTQQTLSKAFTFDVDIDPASTGQSSDGSHLLTAVSVGSQVFVALLACLLMNIVNADRQ